jgi:predicted phosphate transport protein (TIGR00153 family)
MIRFFPRDEKFFDLFESAAEKIEEGIHAMLDLLDDYTNVAEKVKRIKELEHEADQITHQTIDKLNRTFITPLDREDIHELITKMDDIMDFVEAASQRLWLYRVQKPTGEIKDLVLTLQKAMSMVKQAIKNLRDLKNPKLILASCIEINTVENEGDMLLRKAMTSLFDNVPDPINVIKLKEIYEIIEMAIDRCEDVANIIEGVVLKNA